jgi:hypothetical protein
MVMTSAASGATGALEAPYTGYAELRERGVWAEDWAAKAAASFPGSRWVGASPKSERMVLTVSSYGSVGPVAGLYHQRSSSGARDQ